MDGFETELQEVAGPRLAAVISAHLRDAAFDYGIAWIPEGPHFVYDIFPRLFLGRRGRGPLRVAWDTNLLIDYFDHGLALWEGDSLPARVAGRYGEELEALQLIVSIWVMRDIRFQVLRRTLEDAKSTLTARRRSQRQQAFVEFSSALALIEWDEDRSRELSPLILPETELTRALAQMPQGADRGLVEEAVRTGAHVFMTRDNRVLKSHSALRPFGLLVASPSDLLEELCACGALHCLLDRRFAYWPMPDLQRVTHLIDALGKRNEH